MQIDGENAFLGELGEVGANAAINLKSRLKVVLDGKGTDDV